MHPSIPVQEEYPGIPHNPRRTHTGRRYSTSPSRVTRPYTPCASTQSPRSSAARIDPSCKLPLLSVGPEQQALNAIACMCTNEQQPHAQYTSPVGQPICVHAVAPVRLSRSTTHTRPGLPLQLCSAPKAQSPAHNGYHRTRVGLTPQPPWLREATPLLPRHGVCVPSIVCASHHQQFHLHSLAAWS